MYGYAGKILKVDLTENKFSEEPLDPSIAKKFLGGLGLASYYLYRDFKPGTDPFSPDNVVVISPGLFVGSGLGTDSKTTFLSKSPATRGFGRAIVGATIGPQLKKAGYDAVIIRGSCSVPSILVVDDGNIRLDRTDLWGMDTRESQARMKQVYGNSFSTASIGPAGENLLRIAGVDCEERQAARTGIGAVLGSKKLKGIVVHGTGKVEPSNSDKFSELVRYWAKILREHPAAKDDMNYGTGEFYTWMNMKKGTFPSRNWQQGYFQKSFDNLKDGELSHLDPYYWAKKYFKRYHPCPNCNKPCGHIFEIDTGKYKGLTEDGIEYETMYSLGGNLEIDDPEEVANLGLICDLMGMDTLSTGVTISWAMEAGERGLIKDAPKFGFDMDVSGLMAAGDRIYNIEKCFNVREGFSRKDDHLPYRVTHDPIPKGVSKGSYVKEEELQRMLNDYYQARGWSNDGVPTKVKLDTLDLSDIVTDVGAGA